MAQQAILAIDEGTTNSKAVLVSVDGEILSSGSAPVPIQHPQPGWVQQDADDLWQATQTAIADCLRGRPDVQVVAVGVSNQRESILMWDRKTGAPLGPVVSWQCRRTAGACAELQAAGHEPAVVAKTGLPIDPMFPPTKAAWLLQNFASQGQDVCIGTVDSWLIWNLTGRALHATDQANAARTQLFNIVSRQFDPDLCDLFGVRMETLPQVHDSAHVFGHTKGAGVLPDGIPVASAIGDSHGALFSHGAFTPGDGKITFGTGSSVMTTIPEFIAPPTGITTTIAWSLNGQATYAFEGNILVSAAILPWTQALLGLESVEALLELAQSVPDAMGVSLVPAHVGLGSPHWAAQAQGLISGLSFGAGPAQIARAVAESIAFQVNDVFQIMAEAAGGIGRVSVDGGPSRNRFLMQLVANMLNHPVTPCRAAEASALGAAYLAGLATGVWPDLDAIRDLPVTDAEIAPDMAEASRNHALETWRKAIARTTLVV